MPDSDLRSRVLLGFNSPIRRGSSDDVPDLVLREERENGDWRTENVQLPESAENSRTRLGAHLGRRNLENGQFQARIADPEGRNGDLGTENVQFQERVVNGQARITELDGRNGDLQIGYTEFQGRIVELESELQDVENSQAHITELEGRNEDLRIENAELQGRIIALRRELQVVQNGQARVTELEERNEDLRIENAELQDRIMALRRELQVVENGQARVAELEGRNRGLRTENAEFQGRIMQLERQNWDWRTKNAEFQGRMMELRRELQVVENNQARITELEARNRDLRIENAELQGHILKLRREIQDVENSQACITELEARNRDLRTENAEFQGRIMEQRRELQDMENSQACITELEGRNRDLRTENARFQGRLMQLGGRVWDWQTKNAEFQGRIMELERQNKDWQTENVQLQERARESRTRLEAHLIRRNLENGKFQARIAELEGRNGDLRTENVQLQERMEYSQARIAKLEERNVDFQSEIDQTLIRTETSEPTLHKTIDNSCLREESISHNNTNHKGSTTHAMIWKDIYDKGWVIRIPPPLFVLPVVAKHEASISRLEKLQFQCEADMYDEVVKCLEPILEECNVAGGLTISNTSGNRFQGDYAPDISICRGSVVSPLTLCAFVELKHSSAPLGDAHYGQAMDYLLQLWRYQPDRKFYVGMLSCISDNAVLVLDFVSDYQRLRWSPSRIYRDFVPRVRLYCDLTFSTALTALLSHLRSPEFSPPQQMFSDRAGKMLEVLEAPSRVMLGVFPSPPAFTGKAAKQKVDRGELMVVKVAEGPGYDNEVRILKSFAATNTVPFEVPLLVHDSPSHREFGIMPFGEPFRMRRLLKQEDVRLCLKDVLSALTWIHSHGIVHRDVRPDNLIIVPVLTIMAGECGYRTPFSDRPHAVLIDFDNATELDQETCFQGGYVCCPPRLLDTIAGAFDGAPLPRADVLSMEDDESPSTALLCNASLLQYTLDSQTYRPQKSDDLLSFVLMVLTLLVPHSFERFDFAGVHMAKNREFKRLRSLWKELRSSRIWGPIVEAAELEDVPELEKILEVFVVL